MKKILTFLSIHLLVIHFSSAQDSTKQRSLYLNVIFDASDITQFNNDISASSISPLADVVTSYEIGFNALVSKKSELGMNLMYKRRNSNPLSAGYLYTATSDGLGFGFIYKYLLVDKKFSIYPIFNIDYSYNFMTVSSNINSSNVIIVPANYNEFVMNSESVKFEGGIEFGLALPQSFSAFNQDYYMGRRFIIRLSYGVNLAQHLNVNSQTKTDFPFNSSGLHVGLIAKL